MFGSNLDIRMNISFFFYELLTVRSRWDHLLSFILPNVNSSFNFLVIKREVTNIPGGLEAQKTSEKSQNRPSLLKVDVILGFRIYIESHASSSSRARIMRSRLTDYRGRKV